MTILFYWSDYENMYFFLKRGLISATNFTIKNLALQRMTRWENLLFRSVHQEPDCAKLLTGSFVIDFSRNWKITFQLLQVWFTSSIFHLQAIRWWKKNWVKNHWLPRFLQICDRLKQAKFAHFYRFVFFRQVFFENHKLIKEILFVEPISLILTSESWGSGNCWKSYQSRVKSIIETKFLRKYMSVFHMKVIQKIYASRGEFIQEGMYSDPCVSNMIAQIFQLCFSLIFFGKRTHFSLLLRAWRLSLRSQSIA